MITIIYDPTSGVAVADGEVNWHVSHIVEDIKRGKEYDTDPRYSTSNIFTALRLAIVKGNIHHRDIVFQYNNQNIPVNSWGAIVDWPEGFCDSELRASEEILCLAHKKIKETIR